MGARWIGDWHCIIGESHPNHFFELMLRCDSRRVDRPGFRCSELPANPLVGLAIFLLAVEFTE